MVMALTKAPPKLPTLAIVYQTFQLKLYLKLKIIYYSYTQHQKFITTTLGNVLVTSMRHYIRQSHCSYL